jgi:hypothetical protein
MREPSCAQRPSRGAVTAALAAARPRAWLRAGAHLAILHVVEGD